MSHTFTIITPSYNMLKYLKLCSASIKDQSGVEYEHIIIDGGSTDGTVEWLKQQNDIKWVSEGDKGMYDAVNKGLKLAKGDILAYLNCDEQYLPNTLSKVSEYFDKNGSVDILFGSFLVVDENGILLSYRKVFQPRYVYILSSYLYAFSCTMFFRRKFVDNNLLFNHELKAVADADFVLKILKLGYKVGIINDYLSSFIYTGNNMSLGENAKKERMKLVDDAPNYIRSVKPFFNFARLIEKVFSGAYYHKGNIKYNIYTTNINQRTEFIIAKKSQKWPTKNHRAKK